MASSKGGPRHSEAAEPSSATAQIVNALAQRALALVRAGGIELLDPDVLHRRVEGVLNELEAEAQDEARRRKKDPGYASPLLLVPETAVPWWLVLDRLLRDSRDAVAEQNAREAADVGKEAKENPLQKAFLACDAVRARVLQACNGAAPKSPAAIARRQAIFNREPFTPSKPAWENELGAIVAAIHKQGPHQTAALLALARDVEQVKDELSAVIPSSGGRTSGKPVWGEPVLVAHTALFLGVDELVQWSAWAATPARNGAIVRIVNPHGRKESNGAGNAEGGNGNGNGNGKSEGGAGDAGGKDKTHAGSGTPAAGAPTGPGQGEPK